MRFDLRLHGVTGDGVKCRADISVYAASEKQLKHEAVEASKDADWCSVDGKGEPIPAGSQITVEGVTHLNGSKKKHKKR